MSGANLVKTSDRKSPDGITIEHTSYGHPVMQQTSLPDLDETRFYHAKRLGFGAQQYWSLHFDLTESNWRLNPADNCTVYSK